MWCQIKIIKTELNKSSMLQRWERKKTWEQICESILSRRTRCSKLHMTNSSHKDWSGNAQAWRNAESYTQWQSQGTGTQTHRTYPSIHQELSCSKVHPQSKFLQSCVQSSTASINQSCGFALHRLRVSQFSLTRLHHSLFQQQIVTGLLEHDYVKWLFHFKIFFFQFEVVSLPSIYI